jgi:hypothetical protein
LAIGLILAVATPALAEVKFSGFYRLMGYSASQLNTNVRHGDSQQFIDQRLRAQITNTLNDNVAITYQAEIDTPWGEQSKGGIGGGGQFETDGVNVETKHLYLDLKQGDTSARLGLQAYGDEFQGMVVFADMAGATVKHKIGNTSLGLLYGKWDENDGNGDNAYPMQNAGRSDWDDTDFYGVTVSQKISDTFKVGAAVYLLDANDVTDFGTTGSTVGGGLHGLTPVAAPDDHADVKIWYYGLTADAKFGDFGVEGFVLRQEGSVNFNTDPETKDISSQAWMASAKGTMKLANGNIGLRGIFITDDESNDDSEQWLGSFGEYDFVNENQSIFLTDKFVCNYTKERYAMTSAANQGYGLWAFILSGNHTLPKDMYANWGLGYYRSVSNDTNDGPNTRDGKKLGWEGDLRVGKKFFEKVDVSLNAAYAKLGSFYDNQFEKNNGGPRADGHNDYHPYNLHKVYLMVNVPF